MNRKCPNGKKEDVTGFCCAECKYGKIGSQEYHERQQLDVFDHILKRIFPKTKGTYNADI
jgi:hypothetical protein